MEWRKVISVAVLAFVAAGIARADMIEISGDDLEHSVQSTASDQANPPSDNSLDPFVLSVCADLDPLPVTFFTEVPPGAAGLDESPMSSCILSDRQDSFNLCLCTLLGLGLCKSAPWVKKLSVGIVPGWYYDGGPFQIGHSLAASPDCLNSVLACFVQPDGGPKTPPLQYRREVIVSLWRKSQFMPTVASSCGPPTS